MKKLYGVTVAMITPFNEDGSVDLTSVAKLTNFLIEKGVNCLYPNGTTGEMLRLSLEERKNIAKTVVETAAGRVTVFIHCGAATTADTIELVQHAKAIGADGVGVVTPQFIGVNDREMEQFYIDVSNSTSDFSIYLYNIPQCAANDLKTSVIKSIISKTKNIVGIKYSFSDINRTLEYLSIKDFSVLHGNDKVFSALLILGCDGTVSGVSGVFPEPFVALYKAYNEGDIKKAQYYQSVCIKLCDTLLCGTNMAYFKEALKLRGILDNGLMRRPQLEMETVDIDQLKSKLENICNKASIEI